MVVETLNDGHLSVCYTFLRDFFFFLRAMSFTSHSLKIIVVDKNLFEGALNGEVTFFKSRNSWIWKFL